MVTLTQKKTPFDNKPALLVLSNAIGKDLISESDITNAWHECTTKEHKQLFFVLLAECIAITNRQHWIYAKSQRTIGGYANRKSGQVIFNWIFVKFIDKPEFLEAIVRVLIEFTSLSELYYVTTDRNNIYDLATQAKIFAAWVKGNPMRRVIAAKQLVLPHSKPKRKLKDKTIKVARSKASVTAQRLKHKFAIELSSVMNWDIKYYPKNTRYIGAEEFKKEHNKQLESVMFSTKEILKFTKQDFLTWLDHLTGGARKRVYNRIVKQPELWKIVDTPMIDIFKEWQESKEKSNQTLRDFKADNEGKELSLTDQINLKQLEKEAKVSRGVYNTKTILEALRTETVDALAAEEYLKTVKLGTDKVMVFVDDSGSMYGGSSGSIKPIDVAKFLLTIVLLKTETDSGFWTFSDKARYISYVDKKATRFGEAVQAAKQPLVDKRKSLLENYKQLSGFLSAIQTGNGTNLASIGEAIHGIMKTASLAERDSIRELLSSYPIWLLISDGNFNNERDVVRSFDAAMKIMEVEVGYRPELVVLMDVGQNRDVRDFKEVPGLIFVPGQVENITKLVMNVKDWDILNPYTALDISYRNNAYDEVKVVVEKFNI